MPPPSPAALSIVTVTYNSQDALPGSLPPLVEQLGYRDELIVVDNASRDRTSEVVGAVAPQARFVQTGRNAGFAAGCNAGADQATGDLLVFVNPDAVAAPGFLDAIRAPLERGESWSAWMGMVTCEGGRSVNTSGGVLHFTGVAWAGQAGTPVGNAATEAHQVGFLSGACLAIPREEWDRAGGFAGAFFMYHEDVDLSLRLRLRGGQLGIEPSAQVDHDYDFEKGPQKWRLLERNRWATIVRCYPASLLVPLAPALVATEAALLAAALAGGWGTQKLLAYVDAARSLPRWLAERRKIQSTRTITTAEFASPMVAELSSPYLGRVGQVRALRGVLETYWRAVCALLRHLG